MKGVGERWAMLYLTWQCACPADPSLASSVTRDCVSATIEVGETLKTRGAFAIDQ